MASTHDDARDEGGGGEQPRTFQDTLNVDIEPVEKSALSGVAKQDDEEIAEADREILDTFEEKMENTRVQLDRFGKSHQETLMHSCGKLAAKVGGLGRLLEDGDELEQAAIEMATWIDDADFSPYTKQSFLSSVRVFAHLMLSEPDDSHFDDEELPEALAKLDPGKYTRDLDPVPKKSEIIRYDEAIEMAKQQGKIRDQALIMLSWSIGPRPYSETHKLQYKHFYDRGSHYEITIPQEGKTGTRDVRLFVGAPLVRQWLEHEHPAHDDPEAEMGPDTYVWTRHDKNEHICYGTMYGVFQRAGARAGITKQTSPQNFRRSSASYAAGRPTTDEGTLRKRYGWGKDSPAPRHYIARFGGDQAVLMAKAYGMDVDIEPDHKPTAPIECERCEELTERGLDNCVWCSHPIDDDVMTLPTTRHPDAGEKDLLELLLDGEVDADDFRSVKKLEAIIKSRPRFWENLDDLIEKAARMGDSTADDPDADPDEAGDEALAVAGVGTATAWLSARASSIAARWARTKHRVLSMHPRYEHYPPRASRLAAGGVAIGAWLLFMTTVIVPELTRGVAAGDPSSLGMLAVSVLAVVAYAVVDLPSVDDVRADLRV